MNLETAMDDYLAALRSERGLSPNTVAAYRRDLTQYRTFLAESGIDDCDVVTASDIGGFLSSVTAQGATASTGGRKLAAVRGLHRFLVAEGMADVDPSAVVEPPQRSGSLPKALTVDEVVSLLEAPDPATPLGVRDRALLEFMYATGARVAETVGLATEDVDFETRTALVTGKGARQRMVPLGGHAIDAIRDYLPHRLALKRGEADPGALFLNARGRPLTRQGVFYILRGHAVRAGIDKARVSPHVLRHSAATHMVEGGADLRTVQEILGHASISTTQIYTRVSPQHLYEVFVTSHPRSG